MASDFFCSPPCFFQKEIKVWFSWTEGWSVVAAEERKWSFWEDRKRRTPILEERRNVCWSSHSSFLFLSSFSFFFSFASWSPYVPATDELLPSRIRRRRCLPRLTCCCPWILFRVQFWCRLLWTASSSNWSGFLGNIFFRPALIFILAD